MDLSKSLTKRQFIKVASGMGVSATSLLYGTQEGLAKNYEKNHVPYVKALKTQYDDQGKPTGQKPIYDKIHRDEWEVRWTADNARERLSQKVENNFEDSKLLSVGMGPMDESPTGFGIIVRYQIIERSDGSIHTPKTGIIDVRRRLPDTVQGKAAEGEYEVERSVPVVVRETRQRETGCLAQKDWDDIPGGTQMSADGGGFGTFTAAFHYNNLSRGGLVCSGHVTNSLGEIIRDASEEDCGTVEARTDGSDKDYAWVDLNDYPDSPYGYLSDANGGIDIQVHGIITDDELKADIDAGKTYYSQGDANCRQSGGVKYYGGDWVEHAPNTSDGDSGGPVWKESSGDAYVAGVLVSDLYAGGSKATTAETVQNYLGGYFY